jgi:hypothetical protein
MKKKEVFLFYLLAAFEIILCIGLTTMLMMHPEYGILGDLAGAAFIAVGAYTVWETVEFTKIVKRNKYSYGLI